MRSLPLALILGSVLSLGLLNTPSIAAADAMAPPRPFSAGYRLEVDGWPDIRIEHRLSRQGALWLSEMRAAIAVANGWERSRFRVEGERVAGRGYASGYSLLGVGDDYRLDAAALATLPDRQAALFSLSRQANTARCHHPQASPCTLRYLDYEGDAQTLNYRRLEEGELALPAGDFPSVTLETWNAEKPQRRLHFSFHPRVPGLLLAVDYFRDGERRSRLRLDRLSLGD